MLATRAHQAIGDQYKSPIAQPCRISARAPGAFIDHGVETEFTPHRMSGQHRAPIPRADRAHILAFDRIIASLMAMQQTPQLRQIEMSPEQILATEIENRAVLGFAGPVAIGFDDAYVFSLEAGADGCPHNPQEHDRGGSESDEIVPSK
jgi:hypothetical protein